MVVVVVVVVVVVEVVVVGGAVVVVGATVVVGGTVVVEIDDGPDAMGDTAWGIVVSGTVVDVVVVEVVVESTVVEVAGAGTDSDGPLESSTTSGVVGGTCPLSATSLAADVTETSSPVDELPFTKMKPPRTMRAPAVAPIIHKAARRPRRPVVCSSGNPVDGSSAPKLGWEPPLPAEVEDCADMLVEVCDEDEPSPPIPLEASG